MEVLAFIDHGANAVVYKIRQDGKEMVLRIERIYNREKDPDRDSDEDSDEDSDGDLDFDPHDEPRFRIEFAILDLIRESKHPLFVPVYTHEICIVAEKLFKRTERAFDDYFEPIPPEELVSLLCVPEGHWATIETMELSGPDLEAALPTLTGEQKLSAMAQYALALLFLQGMDITYFDPNPKNITIVKTDTLYIEGDGYRIATNGILIKLIDYATSFNEGGRGRDFKGEINELLPILIGSREYFYFTPNQVLHSMKADYPEIVQSI